MATQGQSPSHAPLSSPLRGLDGAQGEIVQAIAETTLTIAALLRDGAADGPRGAKRENRFGDTQVPLDRLTDDLFGSALRTLESVGAVASEESPLAEVNAFSDPASPRYLVLLDPLDGSSNVASGAGLGSIFAVALQTGAPPTAADVVAAGYAVYSWETTFVLATSEGVDSFRAAIDLSAYSFEKTLQMPTEGTTYAVNEGNRGKWSAASQAAIGAVSVGRSVRYSGCFAVDFHRVMLDGGVFAYPGTVDRPEGKLRLFYELIPMAYVARAAGGEAADGDGALGVTSAADLDATTPVYLGSRDPMRAVIRILTEQ